MLVFQVRTKHNGIVALLVAVLLIAGCGQTKSDGELHADSEAFLRTVIPQICNNWNYSKWKEYARRRWKSSDQGPFEFVGRVTTVSPGQYSSRAEKLRGAYEEYFPRKGLTQEETFKAAAEQLGTLEKIESLQMGTRMDNSSVYRVDSLITAKFKKQSSYIYCIVEYVKEGDEGFHLGELIPYQFKFSSMYMTPLPQIMEKHLHRKLHEQNSAFRETEL